MFVFVWLVQYYSYSSVLATELLLYYIKPLLCVKYGKNPFRTADMTYYTWPDVAYFKACLAQIFVEGQVNMAHDDLARNSPGPQQYVPMVLS